MAMISRLSKLPPSTTNPNSDAGRKELAALIHQTLREAETDYEQLVDEAQSSSSSSSSGTSTSATTGTRDGGNAVQSLVAKAGEDIKIARRQYRKALLSASHADRDALFAARRTPGAPLGSSGGGSGGGGNEKVSQKELLVSASSDVTAALRRTQQLLQGELSKSRFASETLAESGEALRELTARYSVFDDALLKSRALIRDLVKKNKSDRWYYETAIRILLATLLWIVVRRLFWGPLWLVVVWPVRTLWWAGAAAVGLGSSGSGSAGSAVVGQSVYSSSSASSSAAEVAAAATVTTAVFVTATPVPEKEAGPEAAAAAAAADEAGDDRQSMSEVVGKIIDGESTTIARNTMSRRLDESPEATDDEIPPAAHMEEVEPQPDEEVEQQPEEEVEQQPEEVVEQQPEEEVEQPEEEVEQPEEEVGGGAALHDEL